MDIARQSPGELTPVTMKRQPVNCAGANHQPGLLSCQECNIADEDSVADRTAGPRRWSRSASPDDRRGHLVPSWATRLVWSECGQDR
jgi:hypothetical protein